jgi:hypothetical protein
MLTPGSCACRLQKVGWIFTQSVAERDWIMDSEEIQQMAAVQVGICRQHRRTAAGQLRRHGVCRICCALRVSCVCCQLRVGLPSATCGVAVPWSSCKL